MTDLSSSDGKPRAKQKPASERRATRRIPIEVEVGLGTETNFFTGFTEDLSDGGLFIATYQSLKVGARLDLTIKLPESDPIVTHGRVMWVREALENVKPGVGVQLVGLSEDDHKRILEFISVRAPLFYDSEAIG